MEPQNRNPKSSYQQTVFVELSYPKPGEAFITAVYVMPDREIPIAKIYREFNENKPSYKAIDFNNQDLLSPETSLVDLKKYLKEKGRSMAVDALELEKARIEQQPSEISDEITPEDEKTDEVKEIRDKKDARDKGPER